MCAALAGGGCSGSVGNEAKVAPDGGAERDAGISADASSEPDCVSTRDYFAQEVWAPVFDRVCIACHSPEGVATAQNAQLQLLPSAYPGFLDANFEVASLMARYAFDGKSVLLRKPLGEMEHGGGPQLEPDSDEYAALERFVELLESDEACDRAPAAASFGDVELLSAPATFRKASIQLALRVPTRQEHDRLEQGGDAELAPMLDGLLDEQAVLERLKDLYNDRFLTDLYLRYVGFAINLLSADQYPLADSLYDTLEDDTLRREMNTAIAREPLELIAHVVRHDRPFSEILTADYTVVNPFSAQIYGLSPQFEDDQDPNEFVEAQVSVELGDGQAQIPHAGVLTTPVFLNRFPTTPTNRNRHRARKLFEFFLATDILRVAARPIDPAESSRYNNPTRDDPQCTGCHRQIDPLAGAFLQWDARDQEEFDPQQQWYPEMFPPGFGKEVMDTADYKRAPQWVAQRIVRDPRFVLSTVHTLYRGITGSEPLAYPEDPDHPQFGPRLTAWQAQDATFRLIGERFVTADMNLKVLIREILLSVYFRAANAQELTPEREIELSAVGTGRLSIPQVLSRKIEAVTGTPWRRNAQNEYLLRDYRILYGGIDSENVTERLQTPNGIMASVAWRMANEMACTVTAFDFTRSKDERRLFPEVELEDVPRTDSGDTDPEAVARIKENIRHLHFQILGEDLPVDDPEIERTYALFRETFDEGRTKLESGELPNNLIGRCRARTDLDQGGDLPEDQRIVADDNYAVRSWMAVLTYLLADYRFLYE